MMENHYLKKNRLEAKLHNVFDGFIYQLLPSNRLFTKEEVIRLAREFSKSKPDEVHDFALTEKNISMTLSSLAKNGLIKEINGVRLERLVKNIENTTLINQG